ncbi:hypothetical protein [Bradyrhizobium nanningense]|nr:hypothetical protein [Bradyrhizobium nanningense]
MASHAAVHLLLRECNQACEAPLALGFLLQDEGCFANDNGN